MTGEETDYSQDPNGAWHAKKNGLDGIGPSKEDAERDLLEKIATQPHPAEVREQDAADVIAATSQFKANVSRVIDKALKTPVTIDGKLCTHVAYYSDEPGFQGYGVNQSSARLNLFKKQKERDDADGKTAS